MVLEILKRHVFPLNLAIWPEFSLKDSNFRDHLIVFGLKDSIEHLRFYSWNACYGKAVKAENVSFPVLINRF
jgi:hypothetical protein